MIPADDLARILALTSELRTIAVRTGAYLTICATSYAGSVTFHGLVGTTPTLSDRDIVSRTEFPGHEVPFASTVYDGNDIGIGITVYTALVVEPVPA